MTVIKVADGLHTERAGDGPPLVLVAGGAGDAGVYEAVVPLLARRFTVLTYDRRGNSRSPSTGDFSVPAQADDVVTVLRHHGFERGYVFGSSGGAIIVLDLLARHADRLLGLVAHEPPLVQILRDGTERQELAELGRIARDEGPIRGFVALAAMTMPKQVRFFHTRIGRSLTAAALWTVLRVRAVRGRPAGGMDRLIGNAGRTLLVELPASIEGYQPDVDALRAVSVPWCAATGLDSVGRPYYRPAHVLGDLVGVRCVDFPGGHVPYRQCPAEFAGRLTTILDEFAVVGERE
jgi:pimeloyl-ACP methyl ester carboxylesterase